MPGRQLSAPLRGLVTVQSLPSATLSRLDAFSASRGQRKEGILSCRQTNETVPLLSAAGVAKPLYQKSLLEAVVIYILLCTRSACWNRN